VAVLIEYGVTVLLEYIDLLSVFSAQPRSLIYRDVAYIVHLKPAFSTLYIFIAPYLPFKPSYIVCLPKNYF